MNAQDGHLCRQLLPYSVRDGGLSDAGARHQVNGLAGTAPDDRANVLYSSRRPVSSGSSDSALVPRPLLETPLEWVPGEELLGAELYDEARQITPGSHAEFGEDLVQVAFHCSD